MRFRTKHFISFGAGARAMHSACARAPARGDSGASRACGRATAVGAAPTLRLPRLPARLPGPAVAYAWVRGAAARVAVRPGLQNLGGRKWVLNVRDWPSQNGVFGSRGKMYGICTPHFNRKYELFLFRGRKTDSAPQILEPRVRPQRRRAARDRAARVCPCARLDLPGKDAMRGPGGGALR